MARRLAKKRSRNPFPVLKKEDDEPPKKSAKNVNHNAVSLWKIPFMIRAQICSYLDLTTMRALKNADKSGKEMVLHYWKSQKTLSLSPKSLKRYFPHLPEMEQFKNIFQIRREIKEIFSWLQPDSIREFDLRGLKIVDWTYLQEMMENEYGPALTSIFNKTRKLRLEGCYLNSDDIMLASEVLPSVEFISISEKTFNVYDESDLILPEMEITGKMKKKKKQNMLKILKDCFPQLRLVKFY